MNQLPVSEEMKAKIEPFRNTETGRYDIEAIRAEMRKQPRARFSGIFSGSADADQSFEHTMLSAAFQLNEEMESAPVVETKTVTVESPEGFDDMYISYEVEEVKENTPRYGAEYEIEIFGAEETDMMDIVTAMVKANVAGDNRDAIGMYLRDGKPNSVFVAPQDLGEALVVINNLGFATDEDENEE